MELNQDTLQTYINSDKVVLVDFYGNSCGPCKMFMPTMERLEKAYNEGDAARVAKIDVEEHPEAALAFDIRKMPTIVLFKNGVERQRMTGGQRLGDLKAAIDALTS